jgi:multiple sugar transport system ATP-binding protein
MIDGAGFFRIFWRILLPVSAGPLPSSAVIWQFTNIWNDFLFGASFGGTSQPMTVALNNLVQSSTGVKEYNVHFAGAILAALPTLLVYIVAGRYFVRGLMAPGQLSGGQRQRVAMGRALVRNPDVFLFDEPLSNLDAKLRVDMRTEIKKLHQKLGTTIVYVTHDQIEAMTLSSRIAVMNRGYVQQLGTPKEIYDTPANLFVATFMGSPAMNIIPARVVVRDGVPHAALTDADGEAHALRFSQANLAAWDGREILLGIRPEAITDPEGADRKSNNIEALSNRVTVTEPAGSDTYVMMTLGGRDAIARMRADAAVSAGQVYDFAVNMERAVAFDPATEARIAP